MTEAAVAAPSILDPPSSAAATPPAPLTPEQAQARLTQLKSDPDQASWREKFAKGDIAARDEFAKLHEAMYRPNGDKPPAETAHEAAQREQFIDGLRVYDVPQEVLQMVRDNTPVSAEERQLAEQRLHQWKSDKAWLTRWFSGDRQTAREFKILNVILGRPVIQQ
jgi:hypothetical protein